MQFISFVMLIFFKLGSGDKRTNNGGQNHVRMPPELVAHIDIPINVLKSFYLLPSLMHRLESLMLASQLRKEIAFNYIDSSISSALVHCFHFQNLVMA